MNYFCSMFRAITCLIHFALACLTTAALADENQTLVSQDPAAGSFMLRAGSADYAPALLLGTAVDVEITGPVAKVVVRQQFYNQSSDYLEGKYVFPLPENAAVNAMSLQIGERMIKGQIQAKEEAQKTYTQALAAGKKAGLLAQRRPNVFTTKVGNIAPKEVVLVELTYLQTVARLGNAFTFTFPMTLTPRYTPNNSIVTEEPLGAQFIFAQQLPTELANPVRIRVRLNNQEGLSAIHSDSHGISPQQLVAHWAITTKNTYVPMDRDFTLQWRLGSDTDASPRLFIDQVDGDYYGLVMLLPPANPKAAAVLAREVIFVIDTSGSMSGTSIEQAKASLQFAITQLSPQQRFNIIEFNSD
jgi:Ca-activated chloride channel homolog